MCDIFKIKLQQTTHALGILAYNQRLLIDNTAEDDLIALLKRYKEQREIVKQLENQLKSVTLKTKSQSQQIQDQRQRRLNSANRAARLYKTIQQIYDLINYRGVHTSPIDQLHYIKKICEDKLRDTNLSDDEDEDELDSRNCTIDDEQNESLVIHPRVVLPQSSTKKRLLTELNQDVVDHQNKRLRYEDSSQSITFECYTSNENLTRPFLVQTDIQLIDNSTTDQQTSLTIHSDDTLSSTTINTTKTASSSSIETSTIAHRFISKKIFKPETCFVCLKRITFGSLSYRCSYCSQSSHSNCKDKAGLSCKTLSNPSMLPPYSPKTPTISNIKIIQRQRMINSEPKKTPTANSSNHTSTLHRRDRKSVV